MSVCQHCRQPLTGHQKVCFPTCAVPSGSKPPRTCECGTQFGSYGELREHRVDAKHWMPDRGYDGRGPAHDR